jgi:hypothetical protein
MICCDDFEKCHIKDRYRKATEEGALIVLLEKGSVMKFKNRKNMMGRPYMFICDLENTLLKHEIAKLGKKGVIANTQIIHEHRPNSCCYYLMCTFDSSQNELKTFEGPDCVKK